MINKSCIYFSKLNKCLLKNEYVVDCKDCSEFRELRVREGETLTPEQIKKITRDIWTMKENNLYPRYAKCDVGESNIHRPSHYGSFTPIDAFVSGLVSKEELKGFFKCNIIKYTVRYEFKNGVEDLNKAKEYTDLLIKLENDELKAGD